MMRGGNFGILLPNTGYTWTEGIATHFIFSYDFIVIGNMLLNVFFAVEGRQNIYSGIT
jgi:hypothetical protein